jgi:branched-chain amino acid transport system permease protein
MSGSSCHRTLSFSESGPKAQNAALKPQSIAVIVVVAALATVVGLFLPAMIASTLVLTLVIQATVNAMLATSVGFLFRQNGLTSFGQAAYFGLAAYIVAVNSRFGFVSAEASIFLALVIPTLLAFLFGMLIVRLPHLAFSMLTLAIAQAAHEFFLKWRDVANGDDGLEVKFPSTLFGIDTQIFQQPRTMVVVVWIAMVLVMLGLALIARSRFGLLTRGIRDNEERARFIGYETLLPRAIVYAIAALVASFAGILFSLYNGFVTPGILHWSLSGEALIMAFIGGPKVLWGPMLGAAVFFMLKDIVGDYTEHWPAIIGMILMIVTIVIPNGLAGSMIRGWRLLRSGPTK